MALAAAHIYPDGPTLARPSREATALYDAAIAAMHDAAEAIVLDDIEARCRAVQKATEFVTTLYLNVDVKREGEIADGLSKVYSHVLGLFLRVNLYNDPHIAGRAIDLLEPLRESWADLDAIIAACEWPNAPTATETADRFELA